VQLGTAIRGVVDRRMLGWFRDIEFHNGSILTKAGFMIANVLSNITTERLKDSIRDTLNSTFIVDPNTILITRLFGGEASCHRCDF